MSANSKPGWKARGWGENYYVASFANYTGSSLGINGVIVDIVNLPAGAPTASDFAFKIGNDSNAVTWDALTVQPTILVRRGMGAGIGGVRSRNGAYDRRMCHRWQPRPARSNSGPHRIREG